MTLLLHCPIICMVSVYTLVRRSGIVTPVHIDIVLNSLGLKPTCGSAILTAALSYLAISSLSMLYHLLLW